MRCGGLVLGRGAGRRHADRAGHRDQVDREEQGTHAAGLVQRLLDADTARCRASSTEMDGYRQWTDPLLREEMRARPSDDSRQKLHASLALLPVDDRQVDYLYGRLLDAAPTKLPVIRDALRRHKDALTGQAVGSGGSDERQGSRQAAASGVRRCRVRHRGRWPLAEGLPLVVDRLLASVQKNPSHTRPCWKWASLRPVRESSLLVAPLSECLSEKAKERFGESERRCGDRTSWPTTPPTSRNAGRSADGRRREAVRRDLSEVQGSWRARTASADRRDRQEAAARTAFLGRAQEKLAKRQANAAVALLRMNQPAKVWPLLKHSPDPRVRSYLIHRLSPLGADAKPS